RAAGGSRALVRPPAALPHGLYAERGPGAAVGVLRLACPRRRGDPGARAAARPDHAPPHDLGDPRDRRRPALDEPLLRTGVDRAPLHVEARLAGRQPPAAGDRARARALRAPATLGKAFHARAQGAAVALRAAAGVRRSRPEVRP